MFRGKAKGETEASLLFWYAERDSFAFSPMTKIEVRLGLALAGGAYSHRILFFESLRAK